MSIRQITAIIPACRLPELTIKAIKHLHQYGGEIQTTVVDNGSPDRDKNSVREALRPGDHLVELGINTGFSHAVNEGLRYAMAKYAVESDAYLILNNDAFVGPHCLAILSDLLER